MDVEDYAAENARLRKILESSGFKLTFDKTGKLDKVIKPKAPRKPTVKHTAVYWARQRGFNGPSLSLVRKLTKDKAVSLRKYKNATERAELVKDASQFLKANGYNVPDKFFNKVPTYVLKNNDFYENVNAVLNSTAESDAKELDEGSIKYSINTSIDRIKRANNLVNNDSEARKKKKLKKPKIRIK